MDINFHYFAVKVIAVMAGYANNDADEIAKFSQYVDDYFDNSPFRITSPPSFRTPIYDAGDSKVYPVQTGIKEMSSLSDEHQRNVIIPFHFIPPVQLGRAGEGYRTTPAKWVDTDNQLITQMLRTLITDYSGHPAFRVFLGILLHIFADTYAHQSFNGFHQKHINNGRVMSATARYYDGSSQEKSYESYAWLPAIGHADLGTAPDETALAYTCMRDNGSGELKLQPERVNAYVFLECAHQILKILCASRRAAMPGEREFAMLDAALGAGFLIDSSRSVEELCRHWRQRVPSINGNPVRYGYNAQDVHDNLFWVNESKLPKNMTRDQISELWSMIIEKAEESDEAAEDGKKQAAYENMEILMDLGAVSPTEKYYYYNTCAYKIRELVNG